MIISVAEAKTHEELDRLREVLEVPNEGGGRRKRKRKGQLVNVKVYRGG
jgi:hypothetical protein